MAINDPISEKSQIIELETKIKTHIDKTISALRSLIDKEPQNAMDLIAAFKYDKIAFDPLSGDPENLIEVINQCQTYLISLKAVEYLLDKHPGESFTLNWGNIPGYDIAAKENKIIAECFAARSYRSNQKLVKDLKRLSEEKGAQFKYEFFFDKEFEDKHLQYYANKYPGIKIVKIDDLSI